MKLNPWEQEGWARAVLGPTWSDFAYRIDDLLEALTCRPQFFCVIVDSSGEPKLAPSDFQWPYVASGGAPAHQQKLAPFRSNTALLEYLRKLGDTIDTDSITRPGPADDPRWNLAFVSEVTRLLHDIDLPTPSRS